MYLKLTAKNGSFVLVRSEQIVKVESHASGSTVFTVKANVSCKETVIEIAELLEKEKAMQALTGLSGLSGIVSGGATGPIPLLTLSSAEANPTSAALFTVNADFDVSVTGFTSGDVTVVNATLSNFAGSGLAYTFDLAPTASGIVSADVGNSKAFSAGGQGNQGDGRLSMVKQIRVGGSSGPNNFTNLNGTAMFDATDDGLTKSLWRSDGTCSGTVLVYAFASNPYGCLYPANVNGTLFFSAPDAPLNFELWRSDGTSAGTSLVKDINPGAFSLPQGFVDVSGTTFFKVDSDGTNSDPLWRTDGTSAGTVLVHNVMVIIPSAFSPMFNFQGTLFFQGDDGTNGRELWRSNGTSATTLMVKDINPSGNSSPMNFRNVSGTLYFLADPGSGQEVWKSDGTSAGTVSVVSFPTVDSGTRGVLINDTIFFSANDGTNGYELWRASNSATLGQVMVRDINPGAGSSFPRFLTNVNGTLFFRAQDAPYQWELWKSDGTSAGTVIVRDINPGGGTSYPEDLVNLAGTLFFEATDGTNNRQLWMSDGSSAGTVMVDTINPSADSDITGFLPIGNNLFLAADDGSRDSQLWTFARGQVNQLRRTKSSSAMLEQMTSAGYGSDYCGNLTNVNGTLFFSNGPGGGPYGLWSSDGTTAGTALVSATPSISDYTANSRFTNVSGTCFFRAANATSGIELWASDGTSAGTILLADIRVAGTSNPRYVTNVSGTCFFAADIAIENGQLWRSDGTTAGTTLVRNDAVYSFGAKYLANVNGTLFLRATDDNGPELWRSDGTSGGTTLVFDGDMHGGNVRPYQLTNVNGTLFFAADENAGAGEGLFISDGTSAGTDFVFPFVVSATNPRSFLNLANTLFFVASDGTNGYELWRSDGTSVGTVMVKDINPTGDAFVTGSGTGDKLVNVNGTLFFRATDDALNPASLWRSDGTSAGTVIVKNVNTGTDDDIEDPVNVAGKLYFRNVDPADSLMKLFVSDGTAGGTGLLPTGGIQTIPPSTAENLTEELAGKLFFRSNQDPTYGNALLKFTP